MWHGPQEDQATVEEVSDHPLRGARGLPDRDITDEVWMHQSLVAARHRRGELGVQRQAKPVPDDRLMKGGVSRGDRQRRRVVGRPPISKSSKWGPPTANRWLASNLSSSAPGPVARPGSWHEAQEANRFRHNPGMATRSRRSCLAVPASSPRMLDKARTLEADEIVIDLEDSVRRRGEGGGAGRRRARRLRRTGAPVRSRFASTESTPGGGTADLTALAAANRGALESVVIPKCEAAAHLEAAARLLHEQERRSDAAGPPVALQALIETATGLVRIGEITGADPRLETLIIGYADLRASLGRPPGADYPGDPWLWVRETVLVNARAAGLAAIDGPSLDVSDENGLRASAASARALGFDGKWAIHPSQIGPINETFSPTREEFERARSVVDALDAEVERGAVQLDGEMVDEASRKQAARLVARGEAAGLGS